MINFVFAGLIIILVPTAVMFVRRRIINRRKARTLHPPINGNGGEENISSLLARESGTEAFPAVQDLPERPYLVKRTVAAPGDAPLPPETDRRSATDRIGGLPRLKQAIVWSEILGAPKGIRSEQDDLLD